MFWRKDEQSAPASPLRGDAPALGSRESQSIVSSQGGLQDLTGNGSISALGSGSLKLQN